MKKDIYSLVMRKILFDLEKLILGMRIGREKEWIGKKLLNTYYERGDEKYSELELYQK